MVAKTHFCFIWTKRGSSKVIIIIKNSWNGNNKNFPSFKIRNSLQHFKFFFIGNVRLNGNSWEFFLFSTITLVLSLLFATNIDDLQAQFFQNLGFLRLEISLGDVHKWCRASGGGGGDHVILKVCNKGEGGGYKNCDITHLVKRKIIYNASQQIKFWN